jgi:hypothetical protein
MDLSLHINDVENITLDDAMYEFTKTELLTDNNRKNNTRRCQFTKTELLMDNMLSLEKISRKAYCQQRVGTGHSTVHFSVSLEMICGDCL